MKKILLFFSLLLLVSCSQPMEYYEKEDFYGIFDGIYATNGSDYEFFGAVFNDSVEIPNLGVRFYVVEDNKLKVDGFTDLNIVYLGNDSIFCSGDMGNTTLTLTQ